MERQRQISEWIGRLNPGRNFTLAPASADASFRRYLRVTFDDGTTRVVMDAPPSHEDVKPWLHVQKLFHDAGVHVPEVYATDLERGYLLLSDLGSTTYLADLTSHNADAHYRAALDALIHIQLASRPDELPAYDRVLLKRELDLFPDWYLTKHVKIALTESQSSQLAAVFEKILTVNLAEPGVYVHRDYPSRNLMVTEPNPGIIDFQDAVYGPITYDLVSLFKDGVGIYEVRNTGGGAAPRQGPGHLRAALSSRRQGRLPQGHAAGGEIPARGLRALPGPRPAAAHPRPRRESRSPGGVHVLKATH